MGPEYRDKRPIPRATLRLRRAGSRRILAEVRLNVPRAQRASAPLSIAPNAAQLALELPAELPRLAIAPEWKDQQRLWGHSFHPMCSYLASFPAALAHAFIARWSRPGDVVLDPFSGRGTTALQACAEGRIGVGNDLNPFAYLLTAAKVEPATPAEARTRLTALRLRWANEGAAWLALSVRLLAAPGPGGALVPAAGSLASPTDGVEPVPLEVALAFHPRTFAQLLFVRTVLRLDDRVDRFLAAGLTGILHGKSASYLSEVMPNTFSMARGYVRDFVARTDFHSPERDLFGCLDVVLGDGLLEVSTRADELAGVDVDHGHRLGPVDDQGSARRQPDLTVHGFGDLLVHSVVREQILLAGPLLDAVGQIRCHRVHITADGIPGWIT